MLMRLACLVSIVAMGAALPWAQHSNLQIPLRPTPASDGRQMFVNYCAPCHGVDGRGNGPVASALKTAPPDLTTLARDNHGVFPARRVAVILRFGVQKPAHGTSQMPVWGPLLTRIDHPDNTGQQFENLRVNNLVRYLETLQTK